MILIPKYMFNNESTDKNWKILLLERTVTILNYLADSSNCLQRNGNFSLQNHF